jgi:DNA-binding NtrC family response regulator
MLDMRMPVLDGWGFAKALHHREPKLLIVVMTAAQDAQRWAQEINAEGCLEKPFTLEELLNEIERVLTSASMQRE